MWGRLWLLCSVVLRLTSTHVAGLAVKICLQLLVNLATDSPAGQSAVLEVAFPYTAAAVASHLDGEQQALADSCPLA